jgi:hypothetical protein
MADSMLSNLIFKLTDVLTDTGLSVNVSTDLELNQTIIATGASVVLKNASGSVIERMQCNFAG